MIRQRPGRSLAAHSDLPLVLRAWLAGHPLLGEAAAELAAFASAPPPTEPAPIWRDEPWRRAYLAELLPDLPDEAAREQAQRNVELLAAGEAEVVITGQQPGFLGGPLYTLHKAATAAAAAAERRRRGRPAVALFWSGDADDDRLEAFRPWLHDPERGTLLRAPVPEGPNDLMLGYAPAATWSAGEAAWLARRAAAVAGAGERDGLAADLAAIWAEAVAANWPWRRLHRRFLLRLLRGADLLVVSGSDPGLHAAAAPLYDELRARRGELARLGGQRGRELEAAGFPAQLPDASLARFLHRAEGGHRLALPPEQEPGVPAADLRPGVAARSLVQDWLFRPSAVVVGPAELAYLKQLVPVYEAFRVPRAPLLPRLFAVCAPARLAPREANGAVTADRARGVDDAADRVAQAAAERLAEELIRTTGLEPDRAAELARLQGRRWRKAAWQLLADQAERQARSGGGPEPPWLRPRGHRQERSMAAGWAAALWGDELPAAVLEAAAEHLADGDRRDWRERILLVPEL